MQMPRERAHNIIDSLSEKKLSEVLSYLEYIKIKEEVEATEEILDDKKLLDSIQKGLAELKAGEVFSLDELKNV